MLADAADIDDTAASNVTEAIDNTDATAELGLAEAGDRTCDLCGILGGTCFALEDAQSTGEVCYTTTSAFVLKF